MSNTSNPVALAKDSLQYYLETGKKMPLPAEIPPELRQPAGVFVSLKKHGQLRGCIGTFMPTQDNAAKEIVANAISAGTQDPRFQPVKLGELSEIVFSVDILKEPERINSVDELDPQKYGVIVRHGFQSGLLLPALEGVDTAEEQVSIARQKAGIKPDEEVELYRFVVTRYV